MDCASLAVDSGGIQLDTFVPSSALRTGQAADALGAQAGHMAGSRMGLMLLGGEDGLDPVRSQHHTAHNCTAEHLVLVAPRPPATAMILFFFIKRRPVLTSG